MSVLCLATLEVHELVEFQHPPLAAAVTLAAFVEDRDTGMMHTLLPFSVPTLESLAAALPPACHSVFESYTGIIILGLWWRGGGSCRSWSRLCSGKAGRGIGKRIFQRVEVDRRAIGDVGRGCRLWRRCVIDVRVLALCARLDGKELVEGEHAGLAAFPALRDKSAYEMGFQGIEAVD
jgi:hypothetical protein